jgi:hypothetical protein
MQYWPRPPTRSRKSGIGSAGRRAIRSPQTSSGTISIAPQGHSLTQIPQPLQ